MLRSIADLARETLPLFARPQGVDEQFLLACQSGLEVLQESGSAFWKPVFEALDFCAAGLPGGAAVVTHADLNALCRADAKILEFSDDLSLHLEQASRALLQRLRPGLFVPASAGRTDGSEESLSPADEEDLLAFLHYLSLMEFHSHQTIVRKLRDDRLSLTGLVMNAVGLVLYSVVEGLFFTFVKHRWPQAMYRTGTWEEQPIFDETAGNRTEVDPKPGPDPGAEATELQETERKRRFYERLREILCRVDASAQAQQTKDEAPSQPARTLVTNLLARRMPILLASLGNFQNMHDLSDRLHMPKRSERRDMTSDQPLQPGPNLTVLQTHESWKGSPNGKEKPVAELYLTQSWPSLTRLISVKYIREFVMPTGQEVRFHVRVFLHRPGGPPCLGTNSLLPMRDFLHPENPMLIHADFLARQADHALIAGGLHMELLGVSQAETPGLEYPEFLFVHRERIRRRLFGWGSKFKETSDFAVLPRQQMLRLVEEDESENLWRSDRKLLQQNLPSLPDDPLAVYFFFGNDDDDSGPTPAVDPSPTPKQVVPV